MDDILDGEHRSVGEDPAAMERRIFRDMCVTVALTTLFGALFAPWRVTTGLLLGGVLALFNHQWLRASVATMFGETLAGARPKLSVARYVLRYVVVATVVFVAHKLNLVSLGATLAGMCAFVVAALVEGLRQLYIAVADREET